MSTIKVLLCRGERKKIVNVEEGDNICDIAAETFNFPKSTIVIQYFDKEFEEWVDVENGYTPSNKEKLNVLETNKEVRAKSCIV